MLCASERSSRFHRIAQKSIKLQRKYLKYQISNWLIIIFREKPNAILLNMERSFYFQTNRTSIHEQILNYCYCDYDWKATTTKYFNKKYIYIYNNWIEYEVVVCCMRVTNCMRRCPQPRHIYRNERRKKKNTHASSEKLAIARAQLRVFEYTLWSSPDTLVYRSQYRDQDVV